MYELCCMWLFSPIRASADEREAVVGIRAGEAVAPAVDLGEGPELILGVTTAGEPGPRSIRLSSVASFNIWKGAQNAKEKAVNHSVKAENWDEGRRHVYRGHNIADCLPLYSERTHCIYWNATGLTIYTIWDNIEGSVVVDRRALRVAQDFRCVRQKDGGKGRTISL